MPAGAGLTLTRIVSRTAAAALLAASCACRGGSTPMPPLEPPPPAAEAAPTPSPAPASAPPVQEEAALAAGIPCGALDCRRFADAVSAFRFVLREAPLALGVGEAHAPAGSERIATTAARFSEELLPLLEGRASHLIVELLNANRDCPDAARPLGQAQQPVTRTQSRDNQRDYLELGVRSRALHIEPFVLTPSCEEFRAIADAGQDAIPHTLSTIAKITTRMLERALLQNRQQGRDGMVVAYGGALHNDLAPSATQASFRYGDALNDFTGGRYVALDLIVREFIKDNAVWRALPWYAGFNPTSDPESYIVLQPSPRSYVLFFPATALRSTPPDDEPSTPAR